MLWLYLPLLAFLTASLGCGVKGNPTPYIDLREAPVAPAKADNSSIQQSNGAYERTQRK